MKSIESSELMVKCDCHGEALEVTHWPEPDEPDSFWFSIWKQGFDNRLCWGERFRWCWNILKTGKPWSDNIILNPEQAKLVSDFLVKHLTPKQ